MAFSKPNNNVENKSLNAQRRISIEEAELIEKFRNLTPEGKSFVYEILKILIICKHYHF